MVMKGPLILLTAWIKSKQISKRSGKKWCIGMCEGGRFEKKEQDEKQAVLVKFAELRGQLAIVLCRVVTTVIRNFWGHLFVISLLVKTSTVSLVVNPWSLTILNIGLLRIYKGSHISAQNLGIAEKLGWLWPRFVDRFDLVVKMLRVTFICFCCLLKLRIGLCMINWS